MVVAAVVAAAADAAAQQCLWAKVRERQLVIAVILNDSLLLHLL